MKHTRGKWFPWLLKWECPREAGIDRTGTFLLLVPRAPRPTSRLPPEPRPRNTKPPTPGLPTPHCLGLLTLVGTKEGWCPRLSISLAMSVSPSSVKVLLKMASFSWMCPVVKLFFLTGLTGNPNLLGLTLFLITRLLAPPGGSFSLFMCRTPDSVSSILLPTKGSDTCILLKWLDNFSSTKLLFRLWQGCRGLPEGTGVSLSSEDWGR